jgi:hypothetical protein
VFEHGAIVFYNESEHLLGDKLMNTIKAAGTLALMVAGCVAQAGAQDLYGASALLSMSDHAQLERWLGAGPLTLEQLYSRQLGDTSAEFHAAVDGKGPTMALMQVTTPAGLSVLVGGYNPQSWSSTDGWHLTGDDRERTGFIFNLSAPALYRQAPSGYILPSQGSYQSYNGHDYGPTFGIGHDLYLNQTLDAGFSWQLTYGDPADSGLSIVDRSSGAQLFTVSALEILALSPVPETASYGMLLAGLGVLGLLSRRRRPAAAP